MNPDPPPKYSEATEPQPPPAGFAPPAAGYPAPPPGSYPPPPPGQYGVAPGQYGAPHSGYPQTGATTVIVQQPHMGPLPGSTFRYGQNPALIVCQHCQATVTTRLDYTTGLLTWLIAGGICLVGCWAGCCFIPFCIDGAKDVKHFCPNCQREVGMFRHIR